MSKCDHGHIRRPGHLRRRVCECRGDVLTYIQPTYDDADTIVWLRDAAIATEAAGLIAAGPSLIRYPATHVRTSGGRGEE